MDLIRPYLLLIALLALLAINAVCFFSGIHYGGLWVQEKWNAQKIADDHARQQESDRTLATLRRYEAQLEKATDDAALARIALARLRAVPVTHLLCVRAPEGDSSAVPSLSAASGGNAAGTGQLRESIEFDPGPQLRAEAERADELVEEFRNFYARWPQ